MATSIKYEVHGQIKIQGAPAKFRGNETLHVCVRDTLRYDVECVELGSRTIRLTPGQAMPMNYRCYYDPSKAHMKFEQIKTIPGGITLSAYIERDEQLLYTNITDLSLAERVDIDLVKIE